MWEEKRLGNFQSFLNVTHDLKKRAKVVFLRKKWRDTEGVFF